MISPFQNRKRTIRAATYGAVCFALVVTLHPARSVSSEEAGSETKHDFEPTKVWTVRIEQSASEYTGMQPTPNAGFGPQRRGANARDTEKNLFGTEFPWAEASVTVNGTTVKKAGIRYSGDITYMVSGFGLKRPLQVQFDKFDDNGKLGSLSGFQLQSMPLDPAKARQVLASQMFRKLQVPAPRATFAEVSLAVAGRINDANLGLYTIVEEIDERFLAEQFGSGKGLLMKPFGARDIPDLGDNWQAYRPVMRPQREATDKEAKRVMEFAKLIHQSSDQEFREKVGDYIDVDAFLRFLAANALTSNLESYMALGHNYALYLEPATQRFHFMPGNLEFSFANFMLMGNAEQLIDLDLTRPYPGESKLPDRLLAIKEVREQYRELLKRHTAESFTEKALLEAIESIEKATAEAKEKEARATVPGFAPQPGFGRPRNAGPQPPELKQFAAKRFVSIKSQLEADKQGYIPQAVQFAAPQVQPPQQGGFGRQRTTAAIDERTFATEVRAPAGFEAKLYAAPPQVSYPVAVACEPSGAIYVAVDEQGSLGRTPGGGKILRLADTNGNGQADEVTTFAKVEHPRGVVYRDGKVWVCHPPELTLFEDTTGDGVADKQELLVTGLTTDQINRRGGDHTTNCVRMGIDGWLYIGVGDYGIQEAKGKDGQTITLRGGGVVRVRPDGTELEIYCTGLRNPFDLAIDPLLNIFTRDNTNDGAGWDTRISLLMQSANYGYTQLFANFTDEIMPTLGTFGNGGGTGGLYLEDPRWPKPYHGALLTGDWGRSEVYRHDLTPNGATYDLNQQPFLTVPRATGMDVDADGKLYVASWRGGEASVYVGPNVGFIAQFRPLGLTPEPFPKLKGLDDEALVGLLAAPQAVTRLHAQGEILRRGRKPETSKRLVALAGNAELSLGARVAAVFTLKQLDGVESHASLRRLSNSPALRPYTMRALTDRAGELDNVDFQSVLDALVSVKPRERAQAAISLGRLGQADQAKHLIPLTMRPKGSAMPTRRPLQNQPDADRVVPHLAVQALLTLNATEACLEALDGPHAAGALWALRSMHNKTAVEGLIRKLPTAHDTELRQQILSTLIRLYHREADYDGSWWGIRPDNTGPYYDRVKWAMTDRIEAVLRTAFQDADPQTARFLKAELARHRVTLAGISSSRDTAIEEQKPIELPKVDPNDPNQVGNLSYSTTLKRTLAAKGDVKKGELLFRSQSCVACHTTADGQTPKGPHLFEIGKRSKAEELVESIVQPSAKLAQGYESYRISTVDGRVFIGFVVGERADATVIRQSDGVQVEIAKADIEERVMQKQSAMPDGLVANLRPEQLADLIAYLQSLK